MPDMESHCQTLGMEVSRACLDPACGVKVKLKQVWQGYHGIVLCATVQGEVFASDGRAPARYERLLAIRAHEGPCTAGRTLLTGTAV